MGLITVMGNFRILKCDELGCNKKMDSSNEGTLKEVAKVCGWKNRDDRWFCPDCVKKEEAQKKSHLLYQ